jgi:hypothetical protein
VRLFSSSGFGRLRADGKTPSPYDLAIFGGLHADLPLTPNAGALIGGGWPECARAPSSTSFAQYRYEHVASAASGVIPLAWLIIVISCLIASSSHVS